MGFEFRNEGSQLFSDYQMKKRDNLSQREFEQAFSSDIPIFGEIIKTSFESLKREGLDRPPHYKNRNWNPDTMNSNIQGNLIEQYGGAVRLDKGTFYLKMNGKILFFKKLGINSKLPSHNPTRNSIKLVNYFATLFEEPDPIVWIGYCVNKSWTSLLGFYAVSIEGKKINWISDLNDIGSELAEIIPINTNICSGDQEQKQLVSVKIKVAKAE